MRNERFKRKERPLIWAHRGASGYAPENTMVSFEKAIEMGADGIELDVQLTKDGKLVVIHDEQVDRTGDATGWVKDLTFEEIRSINFNKDFPEYGRQKIPTLKEVYELLRPTELTVDCEIKTGMIFYPHIEEMVIGLAREMGMEDRILYSDFNHYSCVKLHEIDPSAYVGFLCYDGTIDAVDYCIKHGADAVHPALFNLQYPGYIERAHEAGLDINTWTVNEKEHIMLALKAGVNAIITNYPDRAMEVIRSCGDK